MYLYRKDNGNPKIPKGTKVLVLKQIYGYDKVDLLVQLPNGEEVKTLSQYYSKNNPNTTIMSSAKNLIAKARLMVTPQPTKNFIKAGVVTEDTRELTQEGTALFLNWLFDTHGAEFNEQVVKVLLKKDKDEDEE